MWRSKNTGGGKHPILVIQRLTNWASHTNKRCKQTYLLTSSNLSFCFQIPVYSYLNDMLLSLPVPSDLKTFTRLQTPFMSLWWLIFVNSQSGSHCFAALRRWACDGVIIVSQFSPSTFQVTVTSLCVLSRAVRVQMIAVPSGPGKDFEVPVEIIIGTVPIRKRVPSASKVHQDPRSMHWATPKCYTGARRWRHRVDGDLDLNCLCSLGRHLIGDVLHVGLTVNWEIHGQKTASDIIIMKCYRVANDTGVAIATMKRHPVANHVRTPPGSWTQTHTRCDASLAVAC